MNLNLKSLAMVGTCAVSLIATTTVHAQWITQPFGSGYIHYGPNGQTHTTMPFGSGWITRGGSWNTQPFGNGYIHYGPNGQTHTTTPFGNGWITRGASWNTQPFGNGYIHYGPNGQIHTTMPFGNGWITRGQKIAELFDDNDFYSKVDVTIFADALQIHDALTLMGFAWDLKGAEMVLGKVDKKTSSAMLFEMAANLAVEQGNSNALKQIVALAPECKKYEEQLVLKGKTRGLNKSVTAFPQLVVLQGKDWQKTLSSLPAWEQPALDQYICSSFRGMTKKSADTASMLVNEGRLTMNPLMIAMGALELAKYPYDSKLGIKFEPAQIFAEAAELAIAKQDVDALKQLVALYGTANFKTAEFAKYMQDELAMLGNTRGLKMNGAKCKPGDFSPINFDKLIRTVYYEMPEINNIQ